MQWLSSELLSLTINIILALLVTFLVDFFITRHLIKNCNIGPTDSEDRPRSKNKFVYTIGILPGIATFISLSIPIIFEIYEIMMSPLPLLVFAILIIASSYAGGWIASIITHPPAHVDFLLDEEN